MAWSTAGQANPVSIAAGVAAAVGAALVFGVTSVAEQRSTKRVKKERTGSPKILLDLVRQPLWDIAIVGTVIGFALQVVGCTPRWPWSSRSSSSTWCSRC